MDYTTKGPEFLQQVQDKINVDGREWTAGHTYLLDMTDDELRSMMGVGELELSAKEMREDDRNAAILPDVSIPRNFDWRAVELNGKKWNYVSPVKNQAKCGSCGVFSAIAAVEGRLRVANRAPSPYGGKDASILPYLSEANAYFCHGEKCTGIHVRDVFNNILGGVVPQDDMPYSSVVPGKCNSDKQCQLECYPDCAVNAGTAKCLIKIPDKTPQSHYTKLFSNTWFNRDPNELKKALYLYGPLAITYQTFKSFIAYRGGIYSPLEGEPIFNNHAICLVGYNDDGQYFILKNSWGTGWGEKGFAKMPYGDVAKYVTRNDMPLSFQQVYTPKGFLYNDVFMRDNFNDYGQATVEGAVYKSPDIVPCMETPLPNPEKTLEETWFTDIGKNIVNGANYIYVRGNSLATKENVNFQVHLYYCKSSLLMYPGQWKDNYIQTASKKNFASGVAEGYGSLAIPEEPFLWKPAPLPSNEHYCLIGRVVTDDHPNPLPNINRIDDFAKFIASNPAYVWRNVSLIDKGVFDHSEILNYEQGTLEGETYFLVQPGDNAPIGASYSLSCAAPECSFTVTGDITAFGTAGGTLVRVPANTKANIVFGYKKNNFDGNTPWTIKVRAIYVLPKESKLIEKLSPRLLDFAPDQDGELNRVEPRKGVLVGEYLIQGEAND